MVADVDKRHQIVGVRGVWLAPARLGGFCAHALGVAVVCGDQRFRTGLPAGSDHAPEAAVEGLHAGDGGLVVASVSDHIGVGVVADDRVVGAGLDGFDQTVGQLLGAHLRLLIVGAHMGRRHQHAILAVEHPLLSTVEEKGHVGVLLGLGDPELAQPCVRHDFPESVVQSTRIEHRGLMEGCAIVGHGDEVGERGQPVAGKAAEILANKGLGQLSRAVGPEICEQHEIAVFDLGNLAAMVDHGWLYEFVGLAAGIGLIERNQRIGGLECALAVHNQVEGPLRAVPGLVAVHGVEAATDRRNAAHAELAAADNDLLDGFGRTLRRGISAVEKRVQINLFHPATRGAFDRGEDMVLVAVHTARREQAEDVQGAPARGKRVKGLGEHGVLEKTTVFDGGGDAGQLLRDQAPTADVHVPNFRVAHLLIGQSDVGAGGAEQGVDAFALPQSIPDRGVGRMNGVV